MISSPSLSDFGTHDESAYPELWRGCVGAWAPCLGPTGTRLHDFSRGSNWGTLTNMDAATDWVVSGGRYALDFDGSNDYVTIPNTRAYASGSELTVACWVKRNAASLYMELVNKFIAILVADEDGWLFRWDNNNRIVWTVAQNGGYDQFQSDLAYTSTDWTYLAVNHRFGSGAATSVYFNGFVIAASYTSGTGTRIPDADATSDPILLGVQRYQSNNFNLLAGQMDDVRVYDRLLHPTEHRLLATRRGIAYERRKRRSVFFNAAFFNPAWARNSNVILSPVGAA